VDEEAAQSEDTVVRNFYAPLTIIADGCFSKFRNAATGSPSESRSQKVLQPIKPIKTRSHFVGAVLKNIPLPQPRHGTVCLTPNGPVLLYQIADKAEETRMLVDVKGKLPSVGDGSLKAHIESHYLPHLPQQFHAPIQQALDADRLRTMPNSFLPPKMQGRRGAREGVIMVGDSWNMRHPLTGGGMTVALHDAVLLTEYLRPSEELADLHDWGAIADRLQEWYWKRKHLAGVVNILSIALYDLFGADDQNLSVLREGCFGYFELGGNCVAGPVGLLSALTPKPLLLFYHFFAVAFYSLWLLFTRPFGERKHAPTVLEYPGLMVQSVQVFYAACVVLLPVIWSEITV
jgi:squalene monooxygenase